MVPPSLSLSTLLFFFLFIITFFFFSAASVSATSRISTNLTSPSPLHNSSGSHSHSHSYERELIKTSASSSFSISRYITVDQHGKGQFKSIQKAIDSVPEYNNRWIHIQINAGLYREKVIIPFNKPYIILQGDGRSTTTIEWSDTARAVGTANSATFAVFASNLVARGIGFRNAAPRAMPGASGGQAVAVLLSGDMMAFYDCAFHGSQDTLFDGIGRHYFKGCYIEGSIDFICGHGQSTYKDCSLHVTADSGFISGSITAQDRRNPFDNSGFVFIGCTISGTGQVFLGRAWGAYSRVIFLHTYMSAIILPEGWHNWENPARESTVYYGQYKCTGPGSNTARRVSWSHELSDAEAQHFLQLGFIDGESWLRET